MHRDVRSGRETTTLTAAAVAAVSIGGCEGAAVGSQVANAANADHAKKQ